jgi:hypothetical protein
MTDGQWQILIGVAALIVAVIGVKYGTAIQRRRRIDQRQRAGRNSVSIQSGRDTKIDQNK